MEIYLDVILLQNVLINYTILWVTAKFTKMKTSNLRMFLGALIGAAYVVIQVLFPNLKEYNNLFAKIMLSFMIIAVTFSPEKIKSFLKVLLAFYITTILFGGAVFAFMFMSQSGGIINNGLFVIFQERSWTVMFLAIGTVAIIVRIFWEVLQNRLAMEKLLIPLKIAFESKIIDMSALVDTGNSLHDPLSNMPVVVVEFKAIKDVLPVEIRGIFEDAKENDLNCVTHVVSNSSWSWRFRLIPFTSLGKENGMLIGFKPDYIEIGEEQDKKGVHDVIVGIYNRALSKNEKYKALLSPELM